MAHPFIIYIPIKTVKAGSGAHQLKSRGQKTRKYSCPQLLASRPRKPSVPRPTLPAGSKQSTELLQGPARNQLELTFPCLRFHACIFVACLLRSVINCFPQHACGWARWKKLISGLCSPRCHSPSGLSNNKNKTPGKDLWKNDSAVQVFYRAWYLNTWLRCF